MCRTLHLHAILAVIIPLMLSVAACGSPEDADTPASEATAVESPVDDATDVPVEPTAAPVLRLLADDLRLAPGECTRLSWEANDALRAYIDGEGVDLVGENEVCPAETTTYTLRAVYDGNVEDERTVIIEVSVPTEAPTDLPPPTAVVPTTVPATAAPTAVPTSAVSISFSPANGLYEIPKSDLCTSVSWQTSGVTAVQLERNADGRRDVEPSGTEEVCFSEKEVKYTLWFKQPDGGEDKREIVIKRDG